MLYKLIKLTSLSVLSFFLFASPAEIEASPIRELLGKRRGGATTETATTVKLGDSTLETAEHLIRVSYEQQKKRRKHNGNTHELMDKRFGEALKDMKTKESQSESDANEKYLTQIVTYSDLFASGQFYKNAAFKEKFLMRDFIPPAHTVGDGGHCQRGI